MSNQKVDLKVVLLGKEYGGKTSLVERFIHERFNENLPYQNTIGAAFGAKSVLVHGKSVVLGIWDTAGSERYEAMSRIYYRGAKAAIVCYDLTDDASWDRARFWVQEVKGHEEYCRIYLCGTKRDLLKEERGGNGKDRAMDYHDVTDYADTLRADVFETSSKTGENIWELFTKIASDFVMNIEDIKNEEEDPDKIDLSNSEVDPWHKRFTTLCC